MDNIKEVVRTLLDAKQELKTWQAVGDRYGVSKATVYDICKKGHVPKDKSIRHKLGIFMDKKRYPAWAKDKEEQRAMLEFRKEYRSLDETNK